MYRVMYGLFSAHVLQLLQKAVGPAKADVATELQPVICRQVARAWHLSFARYLRLMTDVTCRQDQASGSQHN